MWKKMGEKKRPGLIRLAWSHCWPLNGIKEPDHDALIEYLNTFVIKGFEIYFGRRNIVYVINKKLN